MSFVIDNSLESPCLLDSRARAHSDATTQRLRTVRVVAPHLLPLEYANVLRTSCERHEINGTQDQALTNAAIVARVGVAPA